MIIHIESKERLKTSVDTKEHKINQFVPFSSQSGNPGKGMSDPKDHPVWESGNTVASVITGMLR